MSECPARISDFKVRWIMLPALVVLALLSIRGSGRITVAAIALFGLFTVALHVAQRRGRGRHPLWDAAGIALDLGLVSAVVFERAGLRSDAWALYLLATISAGFRYGFAVTLGVAGVAATLYGLIVGPTVDNLSDVGRLAIRLVYMVLMGLMSAALAAELRKQQAEKAAARALADQLQAANAELRRYADEKARLAITDGLTGLFNHGYFHQRLGEELGRAQRYGCPVSLLILDLDGFKGYNDSLGHPSGNGLLREMAEILRETVRSTDIPARYGGDEFAVILPQTDSGDALATADRIRTSTEARFKAQTEGESPVTVSIGIATYPYHGKSRLDLIAAADGALYRSKRDGRNRVRTAS